MKTKNTGILQNSLVRIGLVTGGILLIPAVMMRVSSEWNWDETDFIIIGTLIFGTGLMIELVRQKVRDNTQRAILIIALVLAFLYVWAELAVGIFTNLGS
jgi:hypothetical protein